MATTTRIPHRKTLLARREKDPRSKTNGFPATVGAGTWVDEHTWRDDGNRTLWLIRNGVAATYRDLPTTSVRRWAKSPCRFLEGRQLRSRWVTPPGPRSSGRVRVFSKDDLDAIDSSMRKPGSPPRPGWLTSAQIVSRYGVSRAVVDYWKKHPSRLRAGKALRSEWIDNSVRRRGSPSRVLIYCDADVERTLRGEESERPGTGRPAHPQLRPNIRHSRALDALKKILANGPLPSSVAIVLARREGVNRTALYRAKKELRITAHGKHGRGNKSFVWCLPGQVPESRAEAAAGVAEIPLGKTRKRRPGRERSPQTADVYAFCFQECRVKGRKGSVVQAAANARWGTGTIREVSQVYQNCRRHEEGLRRLAVQETL
jgi:hypothetical protein